MIIIGIDPGLSGAIAVKTSTGWFLVDMPTLTTVVGKKKRAIYDQGLLLDKLRRCARPGVHTVAYVEEVGGMPGQSAPRAFNFGFGCGLIRMALVASGIAIEPVRPQEWKSALRVPKDKRASIARACELLPYIADRFDGRSGGSEAQRSGRAEAAMIALYGSQRRNT